MAAFFEDVRTGFRRMPPPVAHDVAAVLGGDVFIGVDRDQITELAGSEVLLGFAVDRRVAQHEAGREEFAAFLVGFVDLPAVFDRGGQRLFAEHMFAGLESGDDMFLVISVRREDQHPFDAGGVDRLLIAVALFRDFGGLPEFDGLLHHRPVRIIGRHRHHLLFGIAQQIVEYVTPAVSQTDHRNLNLFFFRHRKPLFFYN